MNGLTANLIVRMHMALVDEGIGPRDPRDSDRHILEQAAEVCIQSGELSIHDAWDCYLISDLDPRHPKDHDGCVRYPLREVR